MDRLYSGSNTNRRLVSWIQRKCIICKRFLSKRQISYCSKHLKLRDNTISSEINKRRYHTDIKFREKYINYSKERYRKVKMFG